MFLSAQRLTYMTPFVNLASEFEPAVLMQAQINLWAAYSEAHQQGTQCILADSK